MVIPPWHACPTRCCNTGDDRTIERLQEPLATAQNALTPIPIAARLTTVLAALASDGLHGTVAARPLTRPVWLWSLRNSSAMPGWPWG